MVYVVLVNWNGCRDTIECLESLLRIQADDLRIVVCDNGSADNSIREILAWASGERLVEWVGRGNNYVGPRRLRMPDIEIICRQGQTLAKPLITIIDAKENLGFAGACNAGIDFALQDRNAEYVWLLNNDTVVGELALAKLLERMEEEPRAGIAGSTVVHYSNGTTIQGVGVKHNHLTGQASVIGQFESTNSLPDRGDVERNLSYVLGASMLVRRSFLEKVGLMSEQYFLYYEELDWAERSKGLFQIVWAPKSFVFHKEGMSIGTKAKGRGSNLSIYFLSVNSLRFFLKYHPLCVPLAILRQVYIALRFLFRLDWTGCSIVSLAILDFFFSRYRRGEVAQLGWNRGYYRARQGSETVR